MFTDERDQRGRRLVVRDGYHEPREVFTSAGAVEVAAPRVDDKRVDLDTGERKRFASAILPAWARKTPKITELLLPRRPPVKQPGTSQEPRISTWRYQRGRRQGTLRE